MATDKDGEDRKPGLAEFLSKEARSAIQDIRDKLFVEAWSGRSETTPTLVDIDNSRIGELQPNIPTTDSRPGDESGGHSVKADAPARRPSFEDVWGRSRLVPARDERERNQERPEVDHER